jgi:uncharacterized membrane protein
MKKVSNLSLSIAILGAINIAFASDNIKPMEKCYGIAKAGENDCKNLSNTHSCAGQATIDYDKGEFKVVPKGQCTKMNGTIEPNE